MESPRTWRTIANPNAEIPVDKEAIPLFINEDVPDTDITMQDFSFEVGSVVSCRLAINIRIQH
jgi:hypothetical protein